MERSLIIGARFKKIGMWSARAALVCLLGLGATFWSESASLQFLHVWMFDVGQGDALAFRTPLNHTVIIDGGPDGSLVRQLGRVLPPYHRTIDLVLLTHAHADHMNGLRELFLRYDVRQIVLGARDLDTVEYHDFFESVQQEGCMVVRARTGMTFSLGDEMRLTILGPPPSSLPLREEDLNISSMIARLEYKSFSALFMGDSGEESEERLLHEGVELESDILKVGHHGSRFSTGVQFLSAVHPKATLISVGEGNMFKHPHRELIRRIERMHIPIFRTDTDGTIDVKTDGHHIFIHKKGMTIPL